MITNRSFLLPLLVALALVAVVLSVATGSASLGLPEMARAIAGTGDPVVRAILVELRLPRAILAILIGAMLGLSGAALQGYLRNPLAEPAVLGTSNAAALGAVIAFYFGFSQEWAVALPLMAILGGLAGLGILFALAGRRESPLTLILAGIAVATLAGAGISLALNLAPNPFAGMEITVWLLGSLEDRSFEHVALALPCIAVGMMLLAFDGRALDALTLGEDAAAALGTNLKRTRLRLMLGIAIGVGGAVAVSGAIGFIGLIVPHLMRPLTDRAPSSLLLPSALAGAVLLTFSDILVRLIPATTELRLGVVTAFLGVPVFLFHLMRERRLW